MGECILVFSLALALDCLLGDPVYAFHPVRLTGRAIAGVETFLRRLGLSGIFGGFFLVVIVLFLPTMGYLFVRTLLYRLHPLATVLLDTYLAYSSIAFHDLFLHAGKVASALEEENLTKAQDAVQMMVGRDARQLDATGVARAAVESVAESFVDGFLSPVFWFFVGTFFAHLAGTGESQGAIVGMLAYRTINTMDSMVGYRNDRYLLFGRVAARLDDVANFVPARLAIPIVFLAALLTGGNAVQCLKIARRDRLKHDSPNAGHTESCVAGALGLRLGGPTRYPGRLAEKPWFGDGSHQVSYHHIHQSCRLIRAAGYVTAAIFLFSVIVIFSKNYP